MNSFVIILFLIFIFLLAYFFNFYRYFQIRYYPNLSEYIMKYTHKKMTRIKGFNSKIIVSISCRPNNSHKLESLLASLLDQTIKIDQIAFNIPYKTKDGKDYTIKKVCEDVVSVYRCGYDYGKENNIIPTLLREGEYGTVVISLDENIIYGENFLERLILTSVQNSNCAIMFNEGMLVKPEFFTRDILYSENIANVKKFIKSRKINFEYYENYKI
jgi:hypothetical protein